MQWHITDRCGLQCRHCYQERQWGRDLALNDLLHILGQYKALLKQWQRLPGHHPVGHITVTGGDPFVRTDFFELLDHFRKHRKHFTFSILTNGLNLDRPTVQRLKQFSPQYVQVSLEGEQSIHDRIRGQGNFQRTVAAIRQLVQAKIPALIAFTAHKENANQFGRVAQLGQRLGAKKVWADRLIPAGRGLALTDQTLNAVETWRFFIGMDKERLKDRCRTPVSMHRALQFMVSGGSPYHCTAGDSLICVLSGGDMVPCRRMPMVVGNVLQSPMAKIYYESKQLQALRDPSKISKGCRHCRHALTCRGGLRCLSYAVHHDPFIADPGCWVAGRHGTTDNEQVTYENRKSFTKISKSTATLS